MLTTAQINSGLYNNQVLGTVGKQDYRAWGDIFRLSKDVSFGQLRTGFWVDRTDNSYDQYTVDWSAGGQSYVKCTSTTLSSCPSAGAFSYLLHDWANTIQGYVEGDIKPIAGLTLTPGVKYSFYRMSENALVNSSTKLPNKTSQSWDAVLPSFNANYTILPGWSAYAQVAEGFQAPPLNAFFTATPNSVSAETTWNYQIGSVWKSDRLTISGDLYYIDFGNYFTSYKDANSNTIYASAGAASYKGVELEGAYYLGYHLSLYGNASFNSATYANGQWIANAPIGTGALGVIYQDHDGWYGSLIGKAVGRQEGLDNVSNGTAPPTLVDQYALPTYTYADLAVGYNLKNDDHAIPLLRDAKIGLKVNNLFDQHSLIGFAGNDSGSNAPLYWVLPGRSFFGTVEIKF
jgi:iron complex outermembrane receptor protein